MSDKVNQALLTVNPDGPGHPQLRKVIIDLQLQALRATRNAMLEPDDPGYTGIGDIKWNEAPVRVRLGAILAREAMASAREEDVGRREFGLLVVRERIKDPKVWEAYAKTVDASKPPAPGATTTTIDVEVVSPALPEGDK